jgi:hypothetical protein
MAVNTSKTKFILFHTKGKPVNIATNSIVFNNNEIGTQDNPNLIAPIGRIHARNTNKKERSFKLLGILLDKNLFSMTTLTFSAINSLNLYSSLIKLKTSLPLKHS